MPRHDREYVRAVIGAPVVPPGRLSRAVVRVRTALLGAHRAAAPAPVRVLEGLFGLFDNRVLGLLVELDVPERLDRPRSVADLAGELSADEDGLDRLLRYAAGRGFVDRDRRGRYRPNGVTEILRRDHPGSWRGWVAFASSGWFWDAWRHADAPVRRAGASGIEVATGHAFFDYVNRENPSGGDAFNTAMKSGARLQALALGHALDWAQVQTVCDVGGGTGVALESLLREFDHLRGTLNDLPEVVAGAQAGLTDGALASRCEIAGGDFFERVPQGHDRYLLMAIVHDWDDEHAGSILRNVAAVMKPASRAVVVEGVLRERPRDEFVAASDLLMLVLGSGRERTQAQFERLFGDAGLRIDDQLVLASGSTAFVLAPT